MNNSEIDAIAKRIQEMEFEHVFTLSADGTITEPSGVYAPEVYHDETNDIDMAGAKDWDCMTGLTGQYSYNGAVMHSSECVGRGVVNAMLDMCEDGPITFALVVVTDIDADTDNGEDDCVGWAIAYQKPVDPDRQEFTPYEITMGLDN